MPLFKRRGQSEDPGEQSSSPPTRVLSYSEILDRIEEEVVRAERYGRSFVVLCVLPQRLGNEAANPRELAAAAEAVSRHLRFNDRAGTWEDGAVVAVLAETSADVVRAIAHRIVTDLAVRAAGLGHVKWLVGTSTYPDDGLDPPAIVLAALRRAQS